MDLNERDWLDAVADNTLPPSALADLGRSYAMARANYRALRQKASGLNTSTHAGCAIPATKAGARCHRRELNAQRAGFESWACRQTNGETDLKTERDWNPSAREVGAMGLISFLLILGLYGEAFIQFLAEVL